jgi:hypothetical protein
MRGSPVASAVGLKSLQRGGRMSRALLSVSDCGRSLLLGIALLAAVYALLAFRIWIQLPTSIHFSG